MALISGLINRLVGRPGTEKRSWSGSAFADLLHGLNNGLFSGNTAGQPITDTTMIGIASVFAAIRNISDDIAKLDRGVFRDLPRGKVRVFDHPMHHLICQSPNPEMGPMNFFRALVGCALLYGNGYAVIIRDPYTDEPVHLYPVHPWRVRPLRDEAGMAYYSLDGMTTKQPGRANGRIELADMIHIKGFGLNGLMGLNFMSVARNSLGLTMALEEYGASFFGNSALPRGYFYTNDSISPEAAERLKKKWDSIHGGASNANKNAILEQGLKWEKMGAQNNEGQFLESRAFQLLEVCRIFRIPPHKLQDVSKGTMNNMEVNAAEYISDCLVTWVVLIEEELKLKLTRPEDTTIFPKFNILSFFRGDMTARTAYYSAAIQWGWLNRNDIREMEDFNPVEGLDTFLVPVAYAAASALETMTKSQQMLMAIHAKNNGVELNQDGIPTVIAAVSAALIVNNEQSDPAKQVVPELNVAPPEGLYLPGQQIIDSALYSRAANAQLPVLADAIRRVLRTEAEKVSRAAKKSPTDVEAFYGKHPEHIRAAVGPVLAGIAGTLWALSPSQPTDEERAGVDQFITEYTAKHTHESQDDLKTEIEISGIESRAAKWVDNRPEKVAKELIEGLLKLTGKHHE